MLYKFPFVYGPVKLYNSINNSGFNSVIENIVDPGQSSEAS